MNAWGAAFVLIIGWFFCGVIAYGIVKELFRKDCLLSHGQYFKEDEGVCRLLIVFGPVTLVMACIFFKFFTSKNEYKKNLNKRNLKKMFCYIMPKELKKA